MASAEEGPEPLKYQTLTLKVSIHCEGCKKKVKKVLHSIEGVYRTTIDSQQQKVIVTGNVEAETLIKKLLKTGKHAELWPEKKPNNPGNNNSGGGGKKNKNKNKASGNTNEPSENPDSNQTPSTDDSDDSANPDGEGPKNGGKDSPKADNKEAAKPPPPEKQDGAPASGGNAGGAGGAGGGGGGGKKKGKKGQKENNGGGGGEAQAASENTVSKPAAPPAAAGGGGIPSLPVFNYPVYPTPQPPAYVVSYSSVQPSASYGGAYYPMPMNQSSYFYSGATVAAAPGSYYIFSDENANACRIM